MKKSIIVLAVILTATLLYVPKSLERQKMQAAARNVQGQRAELQEQVRSITASLKTLREDLESKGEVRNRLSRAVAASERDLAKSDPESFWAEPPKHWPQWNPLSPYIWIRKQLLPHLPIQPFTTQGTLVPEVASVLAISAHQKASLDARLSKLTSDFHKLQAESVEVSEDHLPEMNRYPGEKITIKVKPLVEEAARFRKELETDLKETLGAQRGELLAKAGKFDSADRSLKTITMVRQKNGRYTIATMNDNYQGITPAYRETLSNHVPEHLIHFFDPILNDPAPAPESAKSPQ